MSSKTEVGKIIESSEDTNFEDNLIEIPIESKIGNPEKRKKAENSRNENTQVSCLMNKRIVVKYIPKQSGIWGNNPKHVLAGGKAETAITTFVVPRLTSGMFVNVLTDSEKSFLEEIMGLEYNALSIYNKKDNFWNDSVDNGVNKVRLTKQDNYLDLSDPEDYIRYKILLANKNFIAPSLTALNTNPKATYQFVIVDENEELNYAKNSMNNTMKSYVEFGKIQDDKDTLRVLVESLTGRPTAPSVKIEFLQTKINELIQADSSKFLRKVTDPMLSTKVLINRGIEAGVISRKGNFLYLYSDGSPLCEINEEPTIEIASKYLNSPKHQDIKFALEANLK